MDDARSAPPPRVRLSAIAIALALHLLGAVLLVRTFAPGLPDSVRRGVAAVLTVTVTAPAPPPETTSSRHPDAGPRMAAAAGSAARKATPREVTAPMPPIISTVSPAPRVAANASASFAGATNAGSGTGAGASGTGPGAGGADDGSGGGGGGGGARAVKIAGDINSSRDYPPASRDARLGHAVIIALSVGTDGAVHGCRIVAPSPDPDADRITCILASERFRFRPARDSGGRPVESTFGWKQRWFRPGEG